MSEGETELLYSPSGEESGILILEDASPTLQPVQLVKGLLTDKMISEALAAKSIDALDQTGSVVDALCQIIAQKIVELGLKDGACMVIPLAALVRRNMKGQFRFNGSMSIYGEYMSQDASLIQESLWERKRALAESRGFLHSFDRLINGLKLGDAALHLSAHMQKGFPLKDIYDFGVSGYRVAINAATEVSSGDLEASVRTTVPVLLARFNDAVQVVNALMETKKQFEIKFEA